MKNSKLLILLLFISLLTLGVSCNDGKDTDKERKAPTLYKISGKITITNQCTNNLADIPPKIYVKKKLKFTSPSVSDSDVDKNNIPTNAVAGVANQKVANYSLDIYSSHRADKWKLVKITKTNRADKICRAINCAGAGRTCKDQATNVPTTPATDNDPTPTEVKKDYNITCVCS